jgi:hypothetical protein
MGMTVIRASRPVDGNSALTAEVEVESHGLVGRQLGSARLPIAARLQVPVVEGDDRGAGQVNSLVERVAGASVLEIEKLVSELQGLRDLLRRETDRVQREMTGYVHLSDAAMKSSTIIADSVSQWKSAADGGRAERV